MKTQEMFVKFFSDRVAALYDAGADEEEVARAGDLFLEAAVIYGFLDFPQ